MSTLAVIGYNDLFKAEEVPKTRPYAEEGFIYDLPIVMNDALKTGGYKA